MEARDRTRTIVKQSCLVVLGLLVIVVAPPLILQLTAVVLPLDWQLMSSVGQSYTGVSAVLTAVAVLAAVYTLNAGQKQGAETERFHTRQMQFQLQLLRLQDPELAGVTNVESEGLDANLARKRLIYANMWMHHFYYGYLSGMSTGADVQASLRSELASTEAGRTYWRQTSAGWAALHPDFAGYVDDEFRRSDPGEEDTAPERSAQT